MRLEVGNVGILSVGNTSAVLDSQIRENALCRALSYDLESKQLYHTQLGTPDHFRAGPTGPLQIDTVIPSRAVPYGSYCYFASRCPSNALTRVTRARTMPAAPKRKAMAPARRPMKRQTPAQKQYSFTRTVFGNASLSSAAGANFIAFGQATQAQFNIAEFSEIQASFDQYKIKKVQYTYSVRFDNADSIETIPANGRLVPRMTYVRDYNDTTVPSSLAELGAYDNCVSKLMNKPVVITYVPEALGTHGPLPNQWISTTAPLVGHFGHKGYIDLWNTNYSTDLKVDVQIKVWFDCKNLR